MRVCPKCQKRYADEFGFCEVDGGKLQKLREMPGVGAVIAGQFELKSVLGRGSMGMVYRGWQRGIDRDVAVKLLRPELVREEIVVKRFEREARAVALVQHPNVVTVFVSGTTDGGVPYLVMEFVDGQVLDDVLKTVGILAPGRSVFIAQQIAAGLGGAHAAGVVHRDLKPANVLLLPGDAVKIVDFGIAKVLQDTGDKLSRTGRVFGTPRYISPEQASGGKVDARADIYSLGVILFRMLTGRAPFLGTGMQLLLAHAQEQPPAPREIRPELPEELDQLILRALKKNPDERFQSAGEMAAALAALPQQTATQPGMHGGQNTLRGVAPGQATALAEAGRTVDRVPERPQPVALPSSSDSQSLGTASQSFSDRTLNDAGIGSRRRLLMLAMVGLLIGGGVVGAVVLGRSDSGATQVAQPDAQPIAEVPTAPPPAPQLAAPSVDATVVPVATDAAPVDAAPKQRRKKKKRKKKKTNQRDYYLLDEKKTSAQTPDVEDSDDDELE